jgi:hypothetical protein
VVTVCKKKPAVAMIRADAAKNPSLEKIHRLRETLDQSTRPTGLMDRQKGISGRPVHDAYTRLATRIV